VAYKTFIAGEEALAADVNGYLMSQTVSRFASTATRTAAIPAPVVNQVTVIDANKGMPDYWNGSAWTPLGVTYQRWWYAPGPWSIPNAGTDIGIGTADGTGAFTMPVTGILIVQGMIQCSSNNASASLMNLLLGVGPSSSPAPFSFPSSVSPPGPANTFSACMPFSARWGTIAAGTSVTLRAKASVNVAGLTCNLGYTTGMLTIIPTEF
jgi:hypothetical protein